MPRDSSSSRARVVLDTNVLVSAHISPNGAPAQLLRLWRSGAFDLVCSPHLLDELARSLASPKLRGRVRESAARDFLQELREEAEVVDDPAHPERVVEADPRDDFLVALARVAQAIMIVSGDRHLLGLTDHEPPTVTPRQLLDRYR